MRAAGVGTAPRRAAGANGLLYGLGAYGLWGVFPFFFDALAPAGSLEILAHRVVWTVLLLTVLLVAVRRLGDLREISSRTWILLTVASGLISSNWLIYIYSVNSDHVVDAALGYFITPWSAFCSGWHCSVSGSTGCNGSRSCSPWRRCCCCRWGLVARP